MIKLSINKLTTPEWVTGIVVILCISLACIVATKHFERKEPQVAELNKYVREGDRVGFRRALRTHSNVDGTIDYGYTPLTLACFWRDREGVAILIDRGADPNRVDANNLLPLSICGGNPECVRILLNAGALPNGPDSYNGSLPLSSAIIARDIEGVDLLLKAGAKLEKKDQFGKTPLDWVNQGDDHAIAQRINEHLNGQRP